MPLLMFPCQHLVSQGFGQSIFPSAWPDTRGIQPQIAAEDGAVPSVGSAREFIGPASVHLANGKLQG